MLRNIKIKIVLAFSVIGIIVITALGLTYTYNLENINNQINRSLSTQEIQNIILDQVSQARVMTCIYLGIFILLMIIMGIIITKVLISPIANLIKSAERATKTERVKYLSDGSKKKNEINDLVSAFDSVNMELKENLNEVTRQKKQIETILVHMTDGIIAFNMEGKITHINPAAKTFLNLENEEIFESVRNSHPQGRTNQLVI